MAASNPIRFSLTAGATFSSGDLYKAVTADSSGHAVLYHAGVATTGGFGVIGTLYSYTATTSGAGSEAVQVASINSPTVKAFAAGSTLAAGNLATFSSDDSHLVAATTNDNKFMIVAGSSGSTGRIVEIARA